MDEPDGSTMYVHDLALELAASGHRPLVYTPAPGAVSDHLVDRGSRWSTVSNLVSVRPDVIHGNHTLETAEAVLRLPGTPAIFVCHGPGGWMAEPPRLSAIARWVAVGLATAHRLAEAGLPPERCVTVPNGVDVERFRLSSRPLPERPRRALVFSNNAAPGGYAETIVSACQARGIEVDIAGKGVGRPLLAPEEVLGGYDLGLRSWPLRTRGDQLRLRGRAGRHRGPGRARHHGVGDELRRCCVRIAALTEVSR